MALSSALAMRRDESESKEPQAPLHVRGDRVLR
eukprot:CAMPEP_0195053654 /NCGR_PEP_ID=MMETSP0448-20130528/2711_1 /TAXON_ID=66468 /ORGANISM="Heterocapsa triquestra, Strain CCMP 448" /LENGTH=32 /DNA_ID= /DNA_START= /DNA_END= /DNA_ORIENTATION=